MNGSEEVASFEDFSSLFLPDLLNPTATAVQDKDGFDDSSSKDGSLEDVFHNTEIISGSLSQTLGRIGNHGPTMGPLSEHNRAFNAQRYLNDFFPMDTPSQPQFQRLSYYHMNPLPQYYYQVYDQAQAGVSSTDSSLHFNTADRFPSEITDNNIANSRKTDALHQNAVPFRMEARSPPKAASKVITNTSTTNPKNNAPNLNKSHFDYGHGKLNSLLDFSSSIPTNIEILDSNDNVVHANLKAFLKGRFMTNDADNMSYMITHKAGDDNSTIKDPKVISCYRRNNIRLLMNFTLSGHKSESRVLKLQTSDYGYNVKRVIKWFQIEVSALSNSLNSVPFDIKDSPNDKDFRIEVGGTLAKPDWMNSSKQLVPLNDFTLDQAESEKFYVVKRLQFRSATPNNGRSSYQSYYHLKIKLSAVVADLFYDNYVDEEYYPPNGQGGNEITICELTSKPIVVRGRAPHFYNDKKDILIKGRSPFLKASFLEINSIMKSTEDVSQGSNHGVHNLSAVAELKSKHQYQATTEVEESSLGKDHDIEKGEDVAEESTNGNDDVEEYMGSSDDDSENKIATKSRLEGTPVDFNSIKKYNYFPISSVYYLPPINVVYFPHGAHQFQNFADNQNNDDLNSNLRRSSNVYFSLNKT